MDSVEVNGLEIAYDRRGDGPSLVLVHGGASDSRDWRPQLEGLSDEFTVIAWEEPGAGRSSDLPSPSFGVVGIADTLAGLIEALGVAPAHVGGLSWGGTVVLELYRRHPEVVASLILADTYAGWKGSLPAEEVEVRLAGVRRELAAPSWDFRAALPGLFAANPNPAVVAEVERIMADTKPESLLHTVEAMAACDLSDLLPEIDVPTLLIWGAEDARSPLETVGRQFSEVIQGAELVVIPAAGHMANLEQPAEFNAAVREFCRAHPLSR